MDKKQTAGTAAGIILFFLILLFVDLDPAKPEMTKMAAIASLMAVLWVTEAIPLAVTSLIPLILFPLMGILNGEETAVSYMNSVIFLYLGGFLLAIAMEQWGLHKRIALKIITLFGGSPNSIVIGFMAAAGFLSMWISNTATAVMMLPIGLAIIHKMEAEFGRDKTKNFSTTLMLGIAYACSIGGISTLIGTPPNLAFIKISKILFPESPDISFGSWMLLAFPAAVIIMAVTILLLTKVYFKFDKALKIEKNFIFEEYKKLGKISFEEKTIGILFSSAALLWIFRQGFDMGFVVIPGWQEIFNKPEFLNDGVVAIAVASLLFFIPSGSKEGKKTAILDGNAFQKVPWGIILLFGGGFALAKGFSSTGLAEYIGKGFTGVQHLSPLIMIFLIALVINFLTELTSNTATAQMILPIMASVSVAIGMNPWLLMMTATLSVSMAFMLPVATPPNTIVFASERLRIVDMVKAGFGLNIISVITVTLIVYILGAILFDLNNFPAWAAGK